MANRKNKISNNRIQQTTKVDPKVKDITIGIYDIDSAIDYYFNNVIKPKVNDGGEVIDVPVIYGSPERWKSVQKGGTYRDMKSGKLQIPLIMYRRTGMERVEGMMGNKIDAADPSNIVRQFSTKYNAKNRYDKWSILRGVKPSQVYHNVIIPDYVKLTYEIIVWTEYVAHQNKIIEDINYNANSYWGDTNSFKFLATMDSFSTENNLEQGADRAIKATFQINLNGYIIPDNVQKDATDFASKTFTAKQLTTTEFVFNDIDNPVNRSSTNVNSTGSLVDEGNTIDSTKKYLEGDPEPNATALTSKYKQSKF
tara:strand:+ start:2965 stop:3894 length:930 start_codon:yes stop_codon:yes gene_type:complete